MDNVKNDKYYVNKILADLDFMIEHSKGLTQEEFESNEVLVDSMLFRLIQVAENSDKLSADFKDKHNELPWRDIKGMRNRIVHDYGVVDLSIVYDTVSQSVPELHAILEKLV